MRDAALLEQAREDSAALLAADPRLTAPENRFLGQIMGFYAREVSFYREVADQVGVRVPRCHHADIGPDGVPFVLLLEEITGARALDQIAGASRHTP